MGFIRGGLLVIVAVLLFWALLLGNLFLTLSLSLSYDNVHSSLNSIAKGLIQEEINPAEKLIQDNLPFMQLYCQNYSEYVFNEQGYTIVIPCEVINQGAEAVILKAFDSFIEGIYYKDYDCSFINCVDNQETQFFYISKQAKDYWQSKFYLCLIISLVLIGLAFVLIEKRTSLPILTGALLISSSIPLLLIDKALDKWVPSIAFGEYFLQISTIFFVKAHTVFLISLISGLIILGAGILLKSFLVGFSISNLFSRKEGVSKDDVKKIVKQEVSKGKRRK